MLKPLFKFAGRVFDTIEELIAGRHRRPAAAGFARGRSGPAPGRPRRGQDHVPAGDDADQPVRPLGQATRRRSARRRSRPPRRSCASQDDHRRRQGAEDPSVVGRRGAVPAARARDGRPGQVRVRRRCTPGCGWLGVLQQDLRLTVEEAFAPEVPASIFTGDYYATWRAVFLRNYERFRLDQDMPPEPAPGRPPAEHRHRQLGVELYLLSDIGFGVMMYLGSKLQKASSRAREVDQYYGWELPPRPLPAPCAPLPRRSGAAAVRAHRQPRLDAAHRRRRGRQRAAHPAAAARRAEPARLAALAPRRGSCSSEIIGGRAADQVQARHHRQRGPRRGRPARGGKGFELLGDPNGSVDFVIEPVETSNRAPASSPIPTPPARASRSASTRSRASCPRPASASAPRRARARW